MTDNKFQSSLDSAKESQKASTNSADTIEKAAATNKKFDSQNKENKPADATAKPSQPLVIKQHVPLSKTAVFACLLSVTAIAGLVAGFYWFEQQQRLAEVEVLQRTEQQVLALQNQTQALLAQQQKVFDNQVNKLNQAISAENQKTIKKLQHTVNRLSATQPTDWLIHEAEYLIRIAGRSLWLERDTSAAIALLNDANARLKELKDPKFLTVREVIHQDIERLKLLPKFDPEELILSLMALTNQVDNLQIAIELPDLVDAQADLELTNSTDDWQENLSRSWQSFLTNFIQIRYREGTAEPLLTPQQQQNLSANLRLKLQQAQWAASNEKTQLYQQSLTDIQAWLDRYFDMSKVLNRNFYQAVENLKAEQVSVNYSHELLALEAIRHVIKNTLPIADEVENTPNTQQENELETKPDTEPAENSSDKGDGASA